jgi:hypothetical protein
MKMKAASANVAKAAVTKALSAGGESSVKGNGLENINVSAKMLINEIS